MMKPLSLTQRLIEQYPNHPTASLPLVTLIHSLAEAGKTIRHAIRQAPLIGLQGEAGSINCQDESQKKLDVFSNDIVLEKAPLCGKLGGIASEENEEIVLTPCEHPEFLLFTDPLDGSSNVDINVTVGTIFSIYRRENPQTPVSNQDFLQPGKNQICAGYIAYGPATQLVITLGDGVDIFTCDPGTGEFILTAEKITVPTETQEFAVNMSRQRFWLAGFRQYVDELLAGKEGPRQKDYNMRWIASMVADVHRILSRGGIFMYPSDQKIPGRLRLMYEANPMAFLMEQAGGKATDGFQRILDIIPNHIHQRTGVILGSASEVQRVTEAMRENILGNDDQS